MLLSNRIEAVAARVVDYIEIVQEIGIAVGSGQSRIGQRDGWPDQRMAHVAQIKLAPHSAGFGQGAERVEKQETPFAVETCRTRLSRSPTFVFGTLHHGKRVFHPTAG